MARLHTTYHDNIKIEFVNHIDFLIGEIFYLIHNCYRQTVKSKQRLSCIIFPTYIFSPEFNNNWFCSTSIRYKNGNRFRKDISLRKLDLRLKSYVFINYIGDFYTSPNVVYLIRSTV